MKARQVCMVKTMVVLALVRRNVNVMLLDAQLSTIESTDALGNRP